MTDEQFRALRTLILDQSVKIEELRLEVRALKEAQQKTEVVFLEPEDHCDRVDIPEDIRKLLGP